jgi:hypothetical protein
MLAAPWPVTCVRLICNSRNVVIPDNADKPWSVIRVWLMLRLTRGNPAEVYTRMP